LTKGFILAHPAHKIFPWQKGQLLVYQAHLDQRILASPFDKKEFPCGNSLGKRVLVNKKPWQEASLDTRLAELPLQNNIGAP